MHAAPLDDPGAKLYIHLCLMNIYAPAGEWYLGHSRPLARPDSSSWVDRLPLPIAVQISTTKLAGVPGPASASACRTMHCLRVALGSIPGGAGGSLSCTLPHTPVLLVAKNRCHTLCPPHTSISKYNSRRDGATFRSPPTGPHAVDDSFKGAYLLQLVYMVYACAVACTLLAPGINCCGGWVSTVCCLPVW